MEEDYNNMDQQDASLNESGSRSAEADSLCDPNKEFGDGGGYEDGFDDEEGPNSFRGNRGRGNFRGRGGPPGWMNGPPMRFRGRGYGPAGPPLRGRQFFRTRGSPRFSNFEPNWGPMGPPPPMMGGPPPFGPPPGMMPPGGPMGPPPNMMGQPPPYGGPPPNMPPPNMPAPELWVETKSEDGKPYYYHCRTRETTWTRPDSPAVKVVTQAEMEAMAASGQLNQAMGPQTMQMPMGVMPGGMPPTGMPPTGMPPGNMPPGNMPPGNMPPGNMPPGNMPPGNMPPGNMPPGGMPPSGMPPSGMPPSGMPPSGMPPGGMPPTGMPPGGMPPAGMPPGGMPPGGMPPGGMPSGGMPPGGMPPGGMPPGGMPPGGMPPGGMPPGIMPPGHQMPFMSQPPPWVKEGQGQGQEKPEQSSPPAGAVDEPAPAASNAGSASFPGGGSFTSPPGAGYGAPPGLPPGWAPPGWPAWPPQLVPNDAASHAGSSPQQTPTSTGPPAARAQEPAPSDAAPDTTVPPTLAALAAEWTTHAAPDGRPYYYHAATHESVWEKPKPLKELDELKAKIQAEKDRAEKLLIIKDKQIKKDLEVIDVDAHEEAVAAAAAREVEEREREERERHEREERERQEKEDKEREKEKAKQDRTRPVSSTPINGTPWCVVWTGDGRVFFYNPTAHASVWERPAQLLGRADVDRAVATPPAHAQRKDTSQNAVSSSTGGAGSKPANGESKRGGDDSDGEPQHKRTRHDAGSSGSAASSSSGGGGGTGGSAQIPPGASAAMEAEVRAARERGVVPHATRAAAFRDMLRDRAVSAFSTWEKELHKIVFDPRYLMLNSKERRQAFDQYVRERAEEERKEKKNRLQQRRLCFRALLEDAKLHAKSTFADFSSKHGRDERFKGIEKARERELYFNEYIAELRKKEKEDKDKKREQAKQEFLALLKERAVDRHARFTELKKKLEADPRYKAVEGGAAREDYFREYCKHLKDDRKKDKDLKERERSSKKDKKDRDSKKDKKKDKPEKNAENAEQPTTEAPTNDSAAAAAEEVPGEQADGEEDARERERAAIKEREREVQRALATSLRDRDKEREHHKRDEAVTHFNALLADLVRNPELSWRDAKKQLKKDHRYTLAELLSKDDKERLFSAHTETLAARRRDKLFAALQALGATPATSWRQARALLAAAPTPLPSYASPAQMEREYREFQRSALAAARAALRQLLLESRVLCHRDLAALDTQQAVKLLTESVREDARYAALEHAASERDSMLRAFVDELQRRRPPPPPTASEPPRRAKLPAA